MQSLFTARNQRLRECNVYCLSVNKGRGTSVSGPRSFRGGGGQPLVLSLVLSTNRVPTHTGKTGKPGKMREVFPVREKSGNFRISPESRGIFYQSGKSQGKLDQKIILLFYGESLKTVVSRHSFV